MTDMFRLAVLHLRDSEARRICYTVYSPAVAGAQRHGRPSDRGRPSPSRLRCAANCRPCPIGRHLLLW